MFRRAVVFCCLVVFIVSLSGCCTIRKKTGEEMQGLKNQVSALESQAQSKDEEINNLKEALSKSQEQEETTLRKKVILEVKSRPNVRQIQNALQNAGYNPGAIDGKMGKQTRDAIKAFQKANNLAEDGKVGGKTWSLLKEYLYKKAK